MEIAGKKEFSNGAVYCLKLKDGMLIETTDTFLPFYTKNAIGKHQNFLKDENLGSRKERYMIGVSVMSGCPIRCKFCATGQIKKWRNLTAQEIVEQVMFVIEKNKDIDPSKSQEFKINYTRMGDFGLNVENVKEAIRRITSLHSLEDEKRNWLIPYKKKMTISELGKIKTFSNLKTTLNMTLVDESDFNIDKLKENFDKDNFFIKLSPINPNEVSNNNHLGEGVIEGVNLK